MIRKAVTSRILRSGWQTWRKSLFLVISIFALVSLTGCCDYLEGHGTFYPNDEWKAEISLSFTPQQLMLCGGEQALEYVEGCEQWSDNYAQASDTVQNCTLTIGNDGDATLSYNISDRETVGGGSGSAPPAASLPFPSVPDNPDADNLRPLEEPHFLPVHQEEHVPEQIFAEGDSVEELRDKIQQNGYNFTVDHNWVYDMSPEEKEKFFSRRDCRFFEGIDASEDIGLLAGQLGRKQLPSQFDWRNYDGHSYIGDIKNQGSCGSCYAFGACAAAEGTYNWAMGLYDENCTDLSESFIIWCLGSLPEYNSHFYGCSGSDWDYYELTAMTVEGICNEADFPYQTSPGCGDHWDDPRITFDSWHRIPCGDIEAIKTAIMTYGPVDAAVYAGSAFQAYSDGIYEDSNTACNSSPCYYTYTNHAIALVGWNDNGNPETDGYWILRNSWGADDWGENGYMRIKYHSAVVACEACYMVYTPASAPNMPSSPSPGDHTTGVSVDTDLNWSGGDPDADDTVNYTVYFGTNSTPPFKETIGPYAANQTSISYSPGALSYNSTYYWQIAATDNHGASTTGPVWDFTTQQAGVSATLEGHVSFSGVSQGPKWVRGLEVTFFNSTTGNETAWSPMNATTNSTGVFTITGLDPGTYDIGIKNWTCLSEVNTSVTLTAGNTTVVDFGTTREGDSNNDDSITGADRSLLYSGWGKSQGEVGYDIHYDFNRDSSLTGADRSLMFAYWAQQGDLV